MRIDTEKRPGYLLVSLQGRLDATWSDHFLEMLQAQIRDGQHSIRIDAAALDYLSSAGIRSILRIHRELRSVQGHFGILRASDFVADTLRMSGFGDLIITDKTEPQVDKAPEAESTYTHLDGVGIRVHTLDRRASVQASRDGRWKPWEIVKSEDPDELVFSQDAFAFGVGAPGRSFDDVRERFGEFLGAAGCVAWLPGGEKDSPDYLVQAEQFVPTVHAIESWRFQGTFSHLLRFRPEETGAAITFSQLCQQALDATKERAAAFVAVAEIDGLVGVSLGRSPGLIGPDDRPEEFPQIRDWLNFCGERVHHEQQAIVAGLTVRQDPGEAEAPPLHSLIAQPSAQGLLAHAHAAVFPFQPLPQGAMPMADAVRRVFDGGEPRTVLHLIHDERPAVGLGESAFGHGACWCAPIRNLEEPRA